MMKIRNLRKISGSVIGLLAVICIVVAVNIILSNFSFRKDLTEEKLYLLSDGTKNVLKKLEYPVTLKFFFNKSDPQVPIFLKNYAMRINDLLLEYELAGNGKIVIEKYDPEPDSDAEEWAQRYGLAGQSIGLMGPVLYIGLVGVTGDKEAVIPVIDPKAENLLEYKITRMITQLSEQKKPVVGIISSLPVMGSQPMPYSRPDQKSQKAWFAFEDLLKDYDVRTIDLPLEKIDQEINALIIFHPKDLSDKTLYAIDQFVLRGGHLLAFLDPLCVAEQELQASPQMRFSPKSSNLEKLLTAWGISFNSKEVVADLTAVSRLRTQNNRVEENPVWLSLRKNHMNSDDIITSNIEFIMMPYAGSFNNVNLLKGLTFTSLITSSERSDTIDAMSSQFGAGSINSKFKSGMTKLNLAIRLHGKFKTAFPEGKPVSKNTEDISKTDTKEIVEASEIWIKESIKPGTVVLIGDADMLYDRFCVQEVGFLGFNAHQPINDNLTLFANLVEQIVGSTDLVSIRTRGKTERPFTVVLNLQHNAQDRYMEEERNLQQKLEQAQRRLNELQAQKDNSQAFILTPQQKSEIERFRKQQYDTKKELKLVRRKLRKDIEMLGVRVKVINILLMPVLVLLSGVCYGLYRRRKIRT